MIPDTYSYYSYDEWGYPTRQWISKDGDDDATYQIQEIPALLNSQAQTIADLQAENKRLLEAIDDAYECFSNIHREVEGLKILTNATNKKEGE